jgi:hypothetical protein
LNFVIEPVTNAAMPNEADRIRQEVFEREWSLQLPPLPDYDETRMLTLVARTESNNEPVAALTAVETTNNPELHDSLGLSFEEGVRVARYTRMAVLKPYRGMNIPVRLILEARRRFIIPGRFGYTWLLFEASRAKSSSFCKLLGFHANPQAFHTEYGYSRVLMRNEIEGLADLRDRETEQYLDRLDLTARASHTSA